MDGGDGGRPPLVRTSHFGATGNGMRRKGAAATGWRKVAAATWGHPNDPQIYGDLELDATCLLAFIDDARHTTGVHVTVTHAVGRAIAHALSEHPELNTRLHRGRFLPRESVDIFFVASVAGGKDVSGVKVVAADRKSVVEVAEELVRRVARIREEGEAEVGRSQNAIDSTPFWLLRPVLRLATWLTADRNADLKRLGLPRQAFGSAMVSSVGMFGVQKAYGPLSPLYRIPILALVSEVAEKPVVEDGEIVARPILTITATMDHRFLDGSHAASLARSVRAYLEDPSAFETLPKPEFAGEART
jgi:pyruvate/2-oxoglutarate dehydrogenase complex dihydrolipoamide acyltransferase (E2) component